MKKLSLLTSVLLLSVVACNKDVPDRGGIRFTASLSKVDTKTAYSGEGETDSQGHLTYERINWKNGDLISIYSPQAAHPYDPDMHIADYYVDSHSDENLTSSAKIFPYNGNGLWTTDAETYDFRAAYPSPSTSGMPDGVAFQTGSNVSYTGVIPGRQTVTRKSSGSSVYLPDMRYAYMTATASDVDPLEDGSGVKLVFYPKFSAFEFTVSADEYPSVTLTSFSLKATNGFLTGAFVIPQDDFGLVEEGIPAAKVTNGGKEITVDFGTEGITFTKGNKLSITVLALAQQVSGLTVGFKGVEIGDRSLQLKKANGSPITFGPYLKHSIYGLRFPAMLDAIEIDSIIWDGEYWSSALCEGISWDGEYDGEATIPGGDDIAWTEDPGMAGPFGGLYMSKGYLVKTSDGYGINSDDQLEVLRYYGAESVTSMPQFYHQWETATASAAVDGFTVPSVEQWESIIGMTRAGATVNRAVGKHYAAVTVDLTDSEYEAYGFDGAIRGFLLFPDGAELYLNELVDMDIETVLDNPLDDFSLTLTYDRLKLLCEGGSACAFLPCAGEYAIDDTWAEGGTSALYWTSSCPEGYAANSVHAPDIGLDDIAYRYPIRMVK